MVGGGQVQFLRDSFTGVYGYQEISLIDACVFAPARTHGVMTWRCDVMTWRGGVVAWHDDVA